MTKESQNKAPLTQDEAALKVYSELSKSDQQKIDSLAIAERFEDMMLGRGHHDPEPSIANLSKFAAAEFAEHAKADRAMIVEEIADHAFPTAELVHKAIPDRFNHVMADALEDGLRPSDIPLKLASKNRSPHGHGQ